MTNSSALHASAVEREDAGRRSLLDVEGLRITSGDRTLVHPLDLAIAPGERVGLIGESGSGKSLTCLSIMGLLPEGLRASGRMTLDGADGNLLEAPDAALCRLRGARMSMVFQEPMTALNPLMKVGRQVAEIMTLHGERDRRRAAARAVEMLDRVGIPDPARAALAYPHQLSGGQRQRVMLAMAMANTPDLLLADEPTTALDVTVQSQVLDLMKEQVREAGSSLLFITHDLAVVAGLCERVVIMQHGHVVEAGPIDRVFTVPEHPYTRALLAASALDTDPATGRLVTVPDPDAVPVARAGAPDGGAGPAPRHAATTPGPHDRLPDDPDQTLVFNRLPGSSDRGEPLIRVSELTRDYVRGRTSLFGPPAVVHGLRGVSFDVRQGQLFGIVGESGSGKSTLLRLLCGLDQATSGSVVVAGTELVGARERDLAPLREQVQIVFQDPMGSLDPRMRVEDVVAEPLRGVSARERRSRVEELLGAVGLPADAADRFPHQFSGGQRQRIAIARALITRPRILVADEAVSALDVSVRAQVLNLLSDLVDEYALTLVFVSHDLNVIRHVCDTVAVMHAGRIVECGPTGDVYDQPQHPYTRQLIGALPELRRATTGGDRA